MGIVTAIVMGWVANWFAKSRLRPRPESESRKLVCPANVLIVGTVGLLFCTFLSVAIYVGFSSSTGHFSPEAYIGVTLIEAFFGVGSLRYVLRYFFSRHEVSDEGMNFGRITGRHESLKWSEVARVEYVAAWERFVGETKGSGVFSRQRSDD